MATGFINFRDTVSEAGFANLSNNKTTAVSIPDTPWSVNYRPGFTGSGAESNTGSYIPATGDAAWVAEFAGRQTHYVAAGSEAILDVTGFEAGEPLRVSCYSRYPLDQGRITEWQVNGGTPQDLDAWDSVNNTPNLDKVVVFDTTADAYGNVEISYRNAASSTLTGRAAAIKIEQIAGPSVTIDTEMTPGGTSVLTYDNFDAAPTGTVTATPLDVSGDPISGFTPMTYTGVVANTDTAGVHSGTVTVNWPALVDGETTVPFGTNNVRLSITS